MTLVSHHKLLSFQATNSLFCRLLSRRCTKTTCKSRWGREQWVVISWSQLWLRRKVLRSPSSGWLWITSVWSRFQVSCNEEQVYNSSGKLLFKSQQEVLREIFGDHRHGRYHGRLQRSRVLADQLWSNNCWLRWSSGTRRRSEARVWRVKNYGMDFPCSCWPLWKSKMQEFSHLVWSILGRQNPQRCQIRHASAVSRHILVMTNFIHWPNWLGSRVSCKLTRLSSDTKHTSSIVKFVIRHIAKIVMIIAMNVPFLGKSPSSWSFRDTIVSLTGHIFILWRRHSVETYSLSALTLIEEISRNLVEWCTNTPEGNPHVRVTMWKSSELFCLSKRYLPAALTCMQLFRGNCCIRDLTSSSLLMLWVSRSQLLRSIDRLLALALIAGASCKLDDRLSAFTSGPSFVSDAAQLFKAWELQILRTWKLLTSQYTLSGNLQQICLL